MASFKKFATGLSDMLLGPATTDLFAEREKKPTKQEAAKARQDKISAFIESLGPEFEEEVTGFDVMGDPTRRVRRKEKKEKRATDPKKMIQEALLFDEAIPEVAEKIGLKEKALGLPVAGGGAVLPGPAGGEFDPTQLSTVTTPNFADIVRESLLERSMPGVDPTQARKRVFGFDEKAKSTIPETFEQDIADIFAAGEEIEDPRGELKKLVPLYAGNKEALDRLKLLMSLYPEI